MSDTIKWSALTSEQRDALIAEKVMGLYVKHWTDKELRCTNEDGEEEVWSLRTGYVIIDERFNPGVPRYTTSLDAIKQLRLHMAHRFPLLNLHLIVYAYNRCYAAFTDNVDVDEREWSESNGEHCMEDAICMAALRACGIEASA